MKKIIRTNFDHKNIEKITQKIAKKMYFEKKNIDQIFHAK